MGVNRPGYWFPLALLGFAMIGLALVPARTRELPYDTAIAISSTSETYVLPFSVNGLPYYWPYLVALVFAATVVWYAVRSRPIRFRRFGAILAAVGCSVRSVCCSGLSARVPRSGCISGSAPASGRGP